MVEKSIDGIYNNVIVFNHHTEVTTNTTLNVCGIVMGTNSTGFFFSNEETQEHTNVLELKAVLLGLEYLAADIFIQPILRSYVIILQQ